MEENGNPSNTAGVISQEEIDSVVKSLQELSVNLVCNNCRCSPVNPMMCPLCSKICCLSCLQRWFHNTNFETCPHCLHTTTLHTFIHCPWIALAIQLCRRSGSALFPVREPNPTDLTIELAQQYFPPTINSLKILTIRLTDDNIVQQLLLDSKLNILEIILKSMLAVGEGFLDGMAKSLLKCMLINIRSEKKKRNDLVMLKVEEQQSVTQDIVTDAQSDQTVNVTQDQEMQEVN